MGPRSLESHRLMRLRDWSGCRRAGEGRDAFGSRRRGDWVQHSSGLVILVIGRSFLVRRAGQRAHFGNVRPRRPRQAPSAKELELASHVALTGTSILQFAEHRQRQSQNARTPELTSQATEHCTIAGSMNSSVDMDASVGSSLSMSISYASTQRGGVDGADGTETRGGQLRRPS
ncbi:hypothetical protein OH76DRAFT_638704 [Lentinus brumalis]|uniref:Uncharacterized protein n=1 Tax=Lentinus brumalis TaxID=2498619 RepID=A0A371CHA9_9APHY|nr:hypothetical protein OH76DRAFT_638704 [Polyporus brumalis]